MKKRIISLLLCLVLTVSLVPAAAAADTGDARTVTVRYASGHGIDTHDYEAAFTYSDDLFTRSGYTYRKDLALMSMGLAFAAYTSKDSEKTDNYATGNRNFVSMAEQCGFENIQSNKWMFQPAEADSIGISCASKTIRDNGGSYTLIAVGVRGNNYHAEWGGNARLDASGEHKGFALGRDQVLDYLRTYIADTGISGRLKIWIAGYSRGAAVANLTAARIRQQLPQIAQENTFVYTFAAPAALTAADRPDLQADYDNDHTADGGLKTDWDVSNIFNIISSGDIVARVMPEEWGYHRNGNDRFLPSTAYQNELDDLSIIESRMGGVPLRFDQLATKEDVDSVIAAALAFCKSAANYHEKYEAAFMDMLQCAFTLSEKEAAEGVILDDEAVTERLRSMENIRKMSWTKVLRCVMTASAMSRPILEHDF